MRSLTAETNLKICISTTTGIEKKKKILEHDWKLRNSHSMESEIAFSATVYLVNNELKVSTFNQTWKKKWIISSRPMVEGDELYSCHSPAHVVQLLIMQKVGR